jgi:hypothetical protein
LIERLNEKEGIMREIELKIITVEKEKEILNNKV